MTDCIFCKIAAGELPCAKLIETDLSLGFMDIGPLNPGHSLVIPKRHSEFIVDCTAAELEDCIRIAQRLIRAVMAATGSAGCNLLQNNHACSGQRVPHVHFHVVPRSPDDGFRFGWRTGEYAEGQMDELRQRILERL